MKKYLIALPTFPGGKGWCHPTTLISALTEEAAIAEAKRRKPGCNIGEVKEVHY